MKLFWSVISTIMFFSLHYTLVPDNCSKQCLHANSIHTLRSHKGYRSVYCVYVYCVGSVCVLCGECMCTVWGVYVYRVGSVCVPCGICTMQGGRRCCNCVVFIYQTGRGRNSRYETQLYWVTLFCSAHRFCNALRSSVHNFLRTIIVPMCLVSSQYGTYCSSMEQEP